MKAFAGSIQLIIALTLTGCGAPPQVATPVGPRIAQPAAVESPRIAPPPKDEKAAVAGEVVVQFKEGQKPELQGATLLRPIDGLPDTYVFKLDGGKYTTQASDALAADPRIAYAEPNYRYFATASETEFVPSEGLLGLWGITKIQAPAAWERTRGNSNILVAVIDTGVDYNHQDLKGMVIKGPDLVSNDGDPMDDNGHGTHVAGTIAAASNGQGVVGVAFGVRVLAVKVLDAEGSGSEDTVARGIDSAVQNGAKVINLSLGGPEDSFALKDAIARATRKGVLCVVAAGNDGSTGNAYPAAYADAFAVGATDSNDRRAYFSNYGRYVAIAAPGVSIQSCAPGNDYDKMSGTSMASPHVAGAAALLLSARSDLSPAQLRSILFANGDAVSGFDQTPGVRRLNLSRALAGIGGAPPPGGGGTNPTPSPTGISGISISERQSDGATIRWHTDVPTVGFLEYGASLNYGTTTFYESSSTTEHEIKIVGLKRFKAYHFKVHAKASGGQQWISEDQTFWTKLWWIFSTDPELF